MGAPGRPSIYTPELAAEICTRLCDPRSLRSVCEDPDMPDRSTVLYWVVNDEAGGVMVYVLHRSRARAHENHQ
jgi:hypothetical protein